MALIKCPRCGITVSDKAAACPKCGIRLNGVAEDNSAKNKATTEIIVGLVTAMVSICYFFWGIATLIFPDINNPFAESSMWRIGTTIGGILNLLSWLVLLFFIIVFSSRPKYKVVLVCGTVGAIGNIIGAIIIGMLSWKAAVVVGCLCGVILAASFFQLGKQIKKIGLAILSLVASASFFIESLLQFLLLVWSRPVSEPIILNIAHVEINIDRSACVRLCDCR